MGWHQVDIAFFGLIELMIIFTAPGIALEYKG